MSSSVSSDTYFNCILDKITTTNKTNRDDMIKFLGKSTKYVNFINILINRISTNTDKSKKEANLSAMIDLLLQKSPSLAELDQDLIKKITRLIIEFPIEIIDMPFFDSLEKVFNLLLTALTEQNLPNFILEPTGMYSHFALAIYSSINKDEKDNVFKSLLSQISENSPPLALTAFSYFLATNKFASLKEETQSYFNEYFGGKEKLTNLLKQLFKSPKSNKKVIIKTIKTCLHFFEADEAVSLFLSLSQAIMNLFHQSNDDLRADISVLFANLPEDCSIEIMSKDNQLRSYLPEFCHYFDVYDTPFVENVVTFVGKRKSVEAFPDIISLILSNVKTVRAGVFLTVEFEAYNLKHSLIEQAFPSDVTDIQRCVAAMDMIPVILKRNKLNEQLMKQVSKFYLTLLSKQQLLNNAIIRAKTFEVLPSYLSYFLKFPLMFGPIFITNALNIEDKEILQTIAHELSQLFENQSDELKRNESQMQYIQEIAGDLYCDYFVHLGKYFIMNITENLQEFTSFLRLVKPQVNDRPKNMAEMINEYIPPQFMPILKQKLAEQLEQQRNAKSKAPYFVVMLSYMPSLLPSDIQIIVRFAATLPQSSRDDDVVNRDVFTQIFKALSLRYADAAFESLHALSSEKEKSTFLFFGKKEKTFQLSLRRAILVTIAAILEDTPQISEQNQAVIYKTVTCALPSADEMKDFAEDASKLLDVFPQLKDTVAPKELLEKVVSVPLFAESLPYLVTRQKDAESYTDSIISSWIFHLTLFTLSISKNQDISDLIFRISPKQETLSKCLSSIISKFNLSDPLPFINFAYCCIKSAKKAGVRLNPEELAITLVQIAPLCLSFVREVQSNSFRALIELFAIDIKQTNETDQIDQNEPIDPLKEIDFDLSSDGKIQAALNLFMRIFQKEPQEFAHFIVQQIINKKQITLSLPNALILRSAFSLHGAYLISVSTQTVTLLLSTAPQMQGRTSYHLNNTLVDLSQKSMKEFLPVLLQSSNINYKRELITRLLNSEQRRTAFFEQYNKLLINTQGKDALQLLQIMPAVVHSVSTSDIPETPFGVLVSSLFIWLSCLYSNIKEFSRSELKTAKDELSECFMYIFQRTNLCSSGRSELLVDNFGQFSQTIGKLASILSNVNIERIETACLSIGNMITSDNDSYKLTAGLVFINLQSCLGMCTNLSCVKLCYKLLESIAVTYRSISQRPRRLLCLVFDEKLSEGHVSRMRKEHAAILVSALIDTLNSEFTDYEKETLKTLALVMPQVDRANNDINTEIAVAALRKVTENLGFSMELLEFIEFYVSIKGSFLDFAHNTTLNILYIMDLLKHERDDVRNRARGIIHSLAEDLAKIGNLSNVMGSKDIVQMSTKVVEKCGTIDMNEDLILIVKVLITSLSLQNTPDADIFRTKATSLAVELTNEPKLSAKAMELLQLLLP